MEKKRPFKSRAIFGFLIVLILLITFIVYDFYNYRFDSIIDAFIIQDFGSFSTTIDSSKENSTYLENFQSYLMLNLDGHRKLDGGNIITYKSSNETFDEVSVFILRFKEEIDKETAEKYVREIILNSPGKNNWRNTGFVFEEHPDRQGVTILRLEGVYSQVPAFWRSGRYVILISDSPNNNLNYQEYADVQNIFYSYISKHPPII